MSEASSSKPAESAPATGDKRAISPNRANEQTAGEASSSHAPKRVKTEEGGSSSHNKRGGGQGARRGRRGNSARRGGPQSNKSRRDAVNERAKERGWEASGAQEGDAAEKNKGPRLPKRKVAMLLGYQGTGMNGSQINPGVKTVEGVLFDALIAAQCISEDNADDHAKVQLSRAARTDAGVHALINCIVLKLILTPPNMTLPTLEEHVNSYLPPTLRVWKISRVQASFNPRTTCDGRRYEYVFPSYVLLPPRPGTSLGESASTKGGLKFWAEDTKPNPSASPSDTPADKFWQTFPLETGNHAEEMRLRRAFRLGSTPGLLDAMREAAQQFIGSHNFHNYTTEKAFTDRSASRQMKSIEVSEPFLVSDETEWVSVVIHGQSFMLHQIRKMMGLLIMLTRLRCPSSLIPETYGPSKLHIPKAPALGLMLRGPIYDHYNIKVNDTNSFVDLGKMDENARKEVIEYDSFEDSVQEFKKGVMEEMWAHEAKIDAYTKFLVLLDGFTGNDFAYLNAAGTIPKEAVFVNGKLPTESKEVDFDEAGEDDNNTGVKAEDG